MLILTVTSDTPGFFLIISIAIILSVVGLVGFGLWLWEVITSLKDKPTPAKQALKSWFQIVKGVDVLLILGLLFRAFVLQPFMVDGNSMEPNYHDKEYLLVSRLSYHVRQPQRGEVIIFRFPREPQYDYIKRIIALPGEEVTIKEGKIYVNGQFLDEKYLSPEEQTIANGSLTETFQKTLAIDEYFVLGDNRSHSSDSREWGAVPKANIIGRAWFVVYPIKNFGLVKKPEVFLEQSIELFPSPS